MGILGVKKKREFWAEKKGNFRVKKCKIQGVKNGNFEGEKMGIWGHLGGKINEKKKKGKNPGELRENRKF